MGSPKKYRENLQASGRAKQGAGENGAAAHPGGNGRNYQRKPRVLQEIPADVPEAAEIKDCEPQRKQRGHSTAAPPDDCDARQHREYIEIEHYIVQTRARNRQRLG